MIETGGRWVTSHSRRDPVAEAERQLSGVKTDTPCLVVIGLALGYLLDALDARGWTGRVIAIEPEPALVPALRARRQLDGWLQGRLSVQTDLHDGGAVRAAFAGLVERPPQIVNPVLARTHQAEVSRAEALVARAWFDHAANDEARRQNAGRYLLNTLRNAPLMASEGDVSSLDGLFCGFPALVIGAGPSLDDNMAAIRDRRDRAVIVAVDTALRPLLAAGVCPHLVVAIDPTEANARHLSDLPPCHDAYLVAEGSIDPVALPIFAGRTFFLQLGGHHPWPWLQELGLARGTLRAWGSVLTSAFDLALRLGCNPVVFAGADLAFTDGRPYASGTTYDDEWSYRASLGTTVSESWASQIDAWPALVETGVDGTPTRTAAHLRAFRDWLVEQSNRETARRIVNGSSRGILVGGRIAQQSIADALAACPALPRDPKQILAAARRPDALAADRLRAGIAAVLALGDNNAPLDTWRSFAGTSVSGQSIRAALGEQTCCQPGPATAVSTTLAAHAALGNRGGPHSRMPQPSDLVQLVEYAASARPSRVVEIGSPSGVAGMAVLLASPATTQLTLVGAVGTRATALAAALGLAGRTQDDGVSLAAAGPADLVLLTCLDDRHDLAADITVALGAVAHGGRLAILDHSRIDGGTNMRRALFRVLDGRAGLVLRHGRFRDYRSQLSWLYASGETAGAPGWDLEKFSDSHRPTADRLAGMLAVHLQPKSVLDLGCGAGFWLDAFARAGIGDVQGVEAPEFLQTAGATRHASVLGADLGRFRASRRFDACLCIGVVQRLPRETGEAVLRAAADASDTIVFSAPVPGIGLPGHITERPPARWYEFLWELGFAAHDEIRPLIEGAAGAYSSIFDVMLVFRRVRPAGGDVDGSLPSATLRHAALAAAERFDDLATERQWHRTALEDERRTRAAVLDFPPSEMTAMVLPEEHLRTASGKDRSYRFRTRAARALVAAFPPRRLVVHEDGKPLSCIEGTATESVPPGSYRVDRGEIVFASPDGTDPRVNGRTYTVTVPESIARLEAIPRAVILEHGL